MAKNDAELQALEQPKSRNEEYLNFLCGRAVDINSLPDKPYSRVEEYLEYLCHNRGQGGGGQPQPFNGVENVTYDEARNRTIFKTKGGQQEVVVEGLVTRWKHLAHVTESNIFNIFNPTTFIKGRYYGVNGVVVSDINWGHFNIPCKAGDTFTLFKSRYDSKNFGLLDSNVNWVDNLPITSTTDGAWQKFLVTIPQNQGVTYLSVPVYRDNDYRNQVMVFEGNAQAPAEFIPFTNNREISIDGEKVNISFDASTTELSTNNVVDAIKELDMKVVNAGTGIVTSVNGIQPVNGNVTITSSDIDYDNQTSQLASNNVKDAIDEVKNLINLLQAKNTTTHFVADNTEFEQLKNTTTFVSGDIVYVINSNGVVDYTNTDVANDGKAISLIYDEKVNGFRVLSRDSEKINLKASSVTVEPTINGLNNVQDVLDYLEKDKASLNKNNVFIGHNTFNEVNLLGKNVFVSTVGGKQDSAHKTGIYCGDRRVSTHHNSSPNPKYISAIKIEVLPSVNVGDMVSGVYVTEIEKKADRLTDIVGKTIINDGSFIVEEDKTGVKVIYVPIQKEYTVDTYFLVGKTGDRNLREAWEGYPPQGEYINNLPINNLPQIGNQLNWTTGNGWIIIYSLTDNEMNVREELKLLNDKVNNANRGKVTSVNKQQPNDLGEVTVNAEHIGYDGNTSNIIATNVQEAIDELKDDMALIDTAEIFIVSDKAELDDFLNNPNTLSHGDLIYIIDSTGVVDFNNRPANGGNPVAMIFDNTLTTGNKLRVFSKFSTTAHILAKNVEYDDQTTNLQANNVQGAIGKLNEKIANAGTVKSVNSVMPQVDGDVVLRGENINVEVLFTPGTVQTHLEDIKRLAQTAQNEAQTALLRADNAFNGYNRLNPIVTNNTNEITALKRRSQYRVGDVITTFRQSNNNYTIDNVVFIYLGRTNNTVSATTYPDLATAFGIQSSTANFTLPQIQDIERFFNVNQRTYQKHFIVAKIN